MVTTKNNAVILRRLEILHSRSALIFTQFTSHGNFQSKICLES